MVQQEESSVNGSATELEFEEEDCDGQIEEKQQEEGTKDLFFYYTMYWQMLLVGFVFNYSSYERVHVQEAIGWIMSATTHRDKGWVSGLGNKLNS